MNRDWLLFGSFLIMWLILGGSLFVTQYPHPRGEKHHNHKAMDRGGDGFQKHHKLIWFGWGFGLMQNLVFVITLLLGVKRERLPEVRAPMLVGLLLYLTAFTLLIVSYQQDLTTGTVPFLGPFPRSTTLMILSTWAVPIYFVILFVVKYQSLFWSPDDERKFQQLLSTSESSSERAT